MSQNEFDSYRPPQPMRRKRRPEATKYDLSLIHI